MDQPLVRYSKFLSLILRHQPEKIGLTLDPQGWVAVDELIAKANQHGVALTLPRLQQVVAENDKQRFAFDAAGTRIRANQGHSINIDLGLAPLTPPDVLYHGTAQRFLAAIQQQGLQARSRDYVHLSACWWSKLERCKQRALSFIARPMGFG
jgi:putative RNA 2'-phosphotransferase